MMVLACAICYEDDPGEAALVDLEKLKVLAPELAKKIETQMDLFAASYPALMARKYFEISLRYAECQELHAAYVDAPCMVVAAVTVFVER